MASGAAALTSPRTRLSDRCLRVEPPAATGQVSRGAVAWSPWTIAIQLTAPCGPRPAALARLRNYCNDAASILVPIERLGVPRHMHRRLITLALLTLVAILAVAACDSGEASDVPGAYTVGADEAVEMIESGERTVIDVRRPDEFSDGHVVGALNLSVESDDFGALIAELDQDEPYLVYCRAGNRSARAAEQMASAGITDIADAGGLADLARAGAPVE